MDEWRLFRAMNWVLLGLALGGFVLLMLIPAPYGRYVRRGWGPQISSRAGWILMESPAVIVFAWAFFAGERWRNAAPLVLFALWQLHYVYRTFIYPFRMRGSRTMAVLVASCVFAFVTAPYGYLNGRQLSQFGDYPPGWLADPRFLIGAALFLGGLAINYHSDVTLMKLRRPGETEYKVPTGGLFRWLSCPNYLGEIVEWFGWAIATWSLPGLAFAVWSAANLVPRARANHRFYRERFPDYPARRWALIPHVL
jgi:protein-S-isoprenylcysteine O-methyltransferase Ste14